MLCTVCSGASKFCCVLYMQVAVVHSFICGSCGYGTRGCILCRIDQDRIDWILQDRSCTKKLAENVKLNKWEI